MWSGRVRERWKWGGLLDAEDEGVEFEAGDAEVVGDVAAVEPAPRSGECLERQRAHDTDLPAHTCLSI